MFNPDNTSIIDRHATQPIIRLVYNLKGERWPQDAPSLPHGIVIYNNQKHVVK